LQNIDVRIPLGDASHLHHWRESGSGKSTPGDDILRRALFRKFSVRKSPGAHRAPKVSENLMRSSSSTRPSAAPRAAIRPLYTGMFNAIRDLFSGCPPRKSAAARIRPVQFQCEGRPP
jgi:excinuclease UvrABC ATPase subunit